MLLNLSPNELKRVEELQQIGFGVLFTGMTGVADDMHFSLCYWKYLRGNTTSSVFPYPEAAWRNAIKVWDETLAETHDNPKIFTHGAPSPAERNILKGLANNPGPTGSLSTEETQRMLEAVGYKFCFTAHKGWYCQQAPSTFNGSLDAAVDWAWRHALMNGIEVIPVVTQKCGFTVEIPWRKRRSMLEEKGYQIFADCWVEPVGITTTKAKTWLDAVNQAWEHAVENKVIINDQLTNPPEKEDVFTMPVRDMKTVLEAAGYTFTEVGGWFLPSMERKQLGDETAAVCNAWVHCVNKGSN